ncbi:Receptor expression-enhancing protein isoform 3 [Schistosoma japonicum]|uniref:Receptor expression-enhancing protein n=1 Tax=Schistosoma japonicum TaxID=6182 RepID=A0A4Z2DVX5_SCHJA|nr:Receptor expression-enhancing protein isoform 3 [Schistosoma japonicum]
MLPAFFARLIITVFGVMHPSYRTYKAIKRKDYQEVVTLGMYWVVFSMYITVEIVTDILLQWLPFYYEAKTLFVIWLVTPATSGYSFIYRKVIHPELTKRETEIDEAINRAKERGYSKVVEFGAKGLNYAAKAVLSGAILGQDFLAERIGKRSSSMFELDRRALISHQRLGATEVLDYDDSSFIRSREMNQEDDPFALNWLQMGSTGSLGRHWRPGSKGLSNVPEDIEHVSEDPQSVSSIRNVSTRRSNVAQLINSNLK